MTLIRFDECNAVCPCGETTRSIFELQQEHPRLLGACCGPVEKWLLEGTRLEIGTVWEFKRNLYISLDGCNFEADTCSFDEPADAPAWVDENDMTYGHRVIRIASDSIHPPGGPPQGDGWARITDHDLAEIRAGRLSESTNAIVEVADQAARNAMVAGTGAVQISPNGRWICTLTLARSHGLPNVVRLELDPALRPDAVHGRELESHASRVLQGGSIERVLRLTDRPGQQEVAGHLEQYRHEGREAMQQLVQWQREHPLNAAQRMMMDHVDDAIYGRMPVVTDRMITGTPPLMPGGVDVERERRAEVERRQREVWEGIMERMVSPPALRRGEPDEQLEFPIATEPTHTGAEWRGSSISVESLVQTVRDLQLEFPTPHQDEHRDAALAWGRIRGREQRLLNRGDEWAQFQDQIHAQNRAEGISPGQPALVDDVYLVDENIQRLNDLSELQQQASEDKPGAIDTLAMDLSALQGEPEL